MIKKYFSSFFFLVLGTFMTSPLYAAGSDIEWASAQMEKYPELKWLADKDVRVTNHGTSSGPTIKLSYALFGKTYDELDRTLLTLKSLELFLKGDEESYKEFTKAQPIEEKLTFNSFKDLSQQAQALIQENSELAEAMKIALIFGDLGKTEKARRLAKEHQIEEADHDHFLHQVLEKCPEIFPTYATLSPAIKGWLKKEFPIHLGHLTHLEGGPEMLTSLKKAKTAAIDPKAIDFFMFVHGCDIAGALAHVNNQGSLTYTENIHQTMRIIKETLKLLVSEDETTALKYYINKRAQWLGLDASLKQERILTRIGSMVRFYTPQQGEMLKRIFSQLDEEVQAFILERFDPLISRSGRTPTYVPAVLLNLMSNKDCGDTLEQRLLWVMNDGLSFILNVIQTYDSGIQILEETLAKNPNQYLGLALSQLRNLTLCFNPLAKQAKENPKLFKSKSFCVNEFGDVSL